MFWNFSQPSNLGIPWQSDKTNEWSLPKWQNNAQTVTCKQCFSWKNKQNTKETITENYKTHWPMSVDNLIYESTVWNTSVEIHSLQQSPKSAICNNWQNSLSATIDKILYLQQLTKSAICNNQWNPLSATIDFWTNQSQHCSRAVKCTLSFNSFFVD